MQIPPSGGEGGLAKADAEQAADLQDRRLEHGRLELARGLLLRLALGCTPTHIISGPQMEHFNGPLSKISTILVRFFQNCF